MTLLKRRFIETFFKYIKTKNMKLQNFGKRLTSLIDSRRIGQSVEDGKRSNGRKIMTSIHKKRTNI